MKKIKIAFIALMMMGLGAGVVNAQDKAAAKKDAPAQTDKKAPAGQHLKKDGTPDKRYKENKDASATKSSDKKAKNVPKDHATKKAETPKATTK